MRGLPLIISIISTLAAKRNFVVLQGCGDDSTKSCHDSFWEDIRRGLEAELPNLDPADVRCVDSDASERAALADVAAPDDAPAHFAAAPQRRQWVHGGRLRGRCERSHLDPPQRDV